MTKKILFVCLRILFCIILVGCSGEVDSSVMKNNENNNKTEKTFDKIERVSNKIDDKSIDKKETNDAIINEVEDTAIQYLFTNNMFDPGEENFEEMTREDVLGYFGMELDISSILPNLYEDTERYGFYKFADGSIFDQHLFIYQSDQGQELRIMVHKNKLPISSIVEAYDHEMKNSKVLDNDVIIAHYVNSDEVNTYYAEFIVDDLGIMIITEDITIDDFMDILEYVIQGKEGFYHEKK